ncbi:MAG: hypothetical protein INR66_06715 [Gordonia polyisoprenivorans]|nr:hypothetical protein [Gordonia polyisoprenivorans]
MSNPQPEVIRNFTAARKFPQLIGRTPDGKKILGGPYTVTQAVGAAVVIVVLYLTRSWWMGLGLATGGLIAGALLVGTVMGLGRLRPGGRNPLSLVSGLGRMAISTTAPAPVSRRPRRVRPRSHIVPAAAVIWADPPHSPPNQSSRDAVPKGLT